jgi:adenylate cyclase
MDRTAVKGREKGEFVYELLGEGGKVAEGILRARDRYEAALDAYLDRRFAEAIMGFQEAAQLRHEDSASLTLGQRAEDYHRAPPPKDWDGVFIQHEK